MSSKLRAYYQLTKPGVLYGNVLTAIAGFLLAAAGKIDWLLLTAATVGITLVVAAACVINNFLDQDIDRIMERTKTRPSVLGVISGRAMVIYGTTLLVLGTAILYLWTNWLVVAIGLLGFVTYVWLYGALSKRRSIHGTLVGSISGALPIAGGYAAVSGQIDAGLIITFLIMFFWQFPEFYSIAIYRHKEYAAAGVPVMPVVVGVPATIIQIYIYTLLYVLSTLALTVYGYTGGIYFVIMLTSGMWWIRLANEGLTTAQPEAWARRMFRFSMLATLLLCVMLAVGPVLP